MTCMAASRCSLWVVRHKGRASTHANQATTKNRFLFRTALVIQGQTGNKSWKSRRVGNGCRVTRTWQCGGESTLLECGQLAGQGLRLPLTSPRSWLGSGPRRSVVCAPQPNANEPGGRLSANSRGAKTMLRSSSPAPGSAGSPISITESTNTMGRIDVQ